MKIKLWGARGSLPAPLDPQEIESRVDSAIESFIATGLRESHQIKPFLKSLPDFKLGGYGGNTPCIEVSDAETRLIVDGGSGLRRLGYELMEGPCGNGKGRVDLFFTHFHWDHLIGLPFFAPLFIPGNEIHCYAVQPDLEDVFQNLFKKPYFPVSLSQLGSKIIYHRLEPRKPIRMGSFRVTPYMLDHPDPCWGYKFESGGRTFSHCVDTECTRISRAELGEDLPLYQGVDLMTFDAQYTIQETIEKVNWGHAAAGLGLDIAMREGIKRILFIHHDPASSDQKIAHVAAQTRKYYDRQVSDFRKSQASFSEVQWEFGREGMVFEL